MSQENVEIVRALYESWNTGDMDAQRELHDPDVIMRAPEGWPEPGPEVGREAVMRQFEQMRETWDADAVEPISDFIDAGDRVVVRFRWRGAGRGPEADLELTAVYTVRKGRIFGQEFFWDHAEALETLGLREPAMSRENAEVVRRIYEAWASGDWRASEQDLDPHVVFVARPDFPEFGVFSGPAEIKTYMRRFLEQFERVTAEAEQIE